MLENLLAVLLVRIKWKRMRRCRQQLTGFTSIPPEESLEIEAEAAYYDLQQRGRSSSF